MTSSESFQSVEPWVSFRSFEADPWLIPDTIFSHDNDLLTNALQRSISGTTDCPSSTSSATFAVVTPTVSEPDSTTTSTAVASKRKRGDCSVEGKAGLPPKRRSRPASRKKSQTKFITTDTANFRQMVQQATGGGARYGLVNAPIVKPQPLLRTADVVLGDSDLLWNRQQQHQQEGSLAVNEADLYGYETQGTVGSFLQDFPGVECGGTGTEAETYPVFPTLESWTVL